MKFFMTLKKILLLIHITFVYFKLFLDTNIFEGTQKGGSTKLNSPTQSVGSTTLNSPTSSGGGGSTTLNSPTSSGSTTLNSPTSSGGSSPIPPSPQPESPRKERNKNVLKINKKNLLLNLPRKIYKC